MELEGILRRIEQRLSATGQTANAASKAARRPDAIRNLRRAIAKGRKGISTDTLSALAPVLKTSVAWLMEAEGPEEIEEDAGSRVNARVWRERLLVVVEGSYRSFQLDPDEARELAQIVFEAAEEPIIDEHGLDSLAARRMAAELVTRRFLKSKSAPADSE